MDTEIHVVEPIFMEMEKALNNFISRVEALEPFLQGVEFNEELIKEMAHNIQIWNRNHIEINYNCEDVFANIMAKRVRID